MNEVIQPMPTDEIQSPLSSKSGLPRRALRVREFCEVYGVRRSSAYQQIASGELPSVLIGRTRLIPVDAAEAMLRRPSPMLPSHHSKQR